MKVLLSLCLLLAFPCWAQTSKPKPSRKVFWVGTASLAASKAFDGYSTQVAQSRGGRERNPLFGAHPSDARVALVNAAVFAVETYVFHKTEKSSRRWVRWLGRGYITLAVEQHLRYGACNTLSPDTWRHTGICHP